MKILLIIILVLSSMLSHQIFDFNKNSDLQNWLIVDDVVMGGRSSGSFTLNDDGHGVFQGKVSLENNGGFSSIRYQCPTTQIKDYTRIVLRLKGDGKDYQFRVKANSSDYYSYISSFSTTGKWENIEILLEDMYPSFRGRSLELPNFSSNTIEEIRFLIGNKKQENFKLLIDKIALQ